MEAIENGESQAYKDAVEAKQDAEEAVEQYRDLLKQANDRVEAANALYNAGSTGYFNSHVANNDDIILEDQDGNLFSLAEVMITTTVDIEKQVGAEYTHIGEAGDATNLENMKKALEMLFNVNELRATDNNNTGVNKEPLMVSDYLMAIAQINANGGANTNFHYGLLGQVFGLAYGENLAMGYNNPYDGWYNAEKSAWENNTGGETGHYENLVNPEDKSNLRYTATGMGLNSEGLPVYNEVFTMDFGPGYNALVGQYLDNGKLWTIESYYADFMSYYNGVKEEMTKQQMPRSRLRQILLRRTRL